MKIITVCGSYKFKKEIDEITEKMALEGNCMIAPINLTKANLTYIKVRKHMMKYINSSQC